MPRKSELLDELTTRIGYGETIELLRGWGGRRLQIPKEVTGDHPIALSVGLAAAQQLAYWYGGTELELPAERNAMIETRNACVLRDLDHEATSVVAIRYGLSRRHVRYIRQKDEETKAALKRRASDWEGANHE